MRSRNLDNSAATHQDGDMACVRSLPANRDALAVTISWSKPSFRLKISRCQPLMDESGVLGRMSSVLSDMYPHSSLPLPLRQRGLLGAWVGLHYRMATQPACQSSDLVVFCAWSESAILAFERSGPN